MECVQHSTLLIKVPTGDYVQGKTNYQNERKWLEGERSWWSTAGGAARPVWLRPVWVLLSALCTPFLHQLTGQSKEISQHRGVCTQKSSLDFTQANPLILTVSCTWILLFNPTENISYEQLLKQCQKPGSGFRNQCTFGIKASWEGVKLGPVANLIIYGLC